MTVKRLLSGSAVGIVVAALGGCGPNYSPNTYASTAVQQANKVETGVIVGVRPIDISAPGTTGAVVGAAAGGVAGTAATQGASGVTTALTALGGGLVGGILGTEAEHKINDTTGYEYIVRKTNGDMVSVTQKDEAPLAIGLHVLVIAGTQARIVRDYTVPIEPEKPAGADKTEAKADAKLDPAAGKSAAPVLPAPAVSAAKVEPPAPTPSVEVAPVVPETAGAATPPSADKAAPAAPTPPVAIAPAADKPAEAATPTPPVQAKSDSPPSDAPPAADPPAQDPAPR